MLSRITLCALCALDKSYLGIWMGVFGCLSMGLSCGKGVWANAYGTALSPYGSSQQAVSPASPLQSLSQGE
jgi:hypothetical protein